MVCREIFNPSPQNFLFIPVLNNETHRRGYLCNTGFFAVQKSLISPTCTPKMEIFRVCDIWDIAGFEGRGW
jgi:hypothetical protein